MSLYGNIKRIGSQSFQFDRVYPNRATMDGATSTDGVYPGRYVLVEYGQRYEKDDEGHRVELQDFLNNKDLDLNTYGNVFDSTVWQKVYVKNTNGADTEKYVMVAELNALAPKMDLQVMDTATLVPSESEEPYIQVAENEKFNRKIDYFINENGTYTKVDIDSFAEGVTYYKVNELYLYYGEDNERLHHVGAIEFNKPYFDEIQDTELTYLLHMPKPLELEVNEDIDYHQDKFDIFHGYDIQAEGGNFIGWKPKPEGTEANKVVDVDNNNSASGKTISEETKFSKQELNMYLPAFGDVLGALYDTLFGQATTNGGMRPYFTAQGLTEEDIINPTEFSGDADVSKILANNSQGLAGVLRALFTDSTIPGQLRYYLSADWLAKNTGSDENIPGILNKPKVVVDAKNPDVDLTYNGHYNIDYSNWQLKALIKLMIGALSKADIQTMEMDNAPKDYNKNTAIANQQYMSVVYDRDVPSLKLFCANNELLQYYYKTIKNEENNSPAYSEANDPHVWVGVILDTSEAHDDTLNVVLNNASDLEIVPLENKHFLLWIPLDLMDDVKNQSFTLHSDLPKVEDTIITIDASNVSTKLAAYEIDKDDGYSYGIAYLDYPQTLGGQSTTLVSGLSVSGLPKNALQTIAALPSSPTIPPYSGEFTITGTFESGTIMKVLNGSGTVAEINITSGSGSYSENIAYTATNWINTNNVEENAGKYEPQSKIYLNEQTFSSDESYPDINTLVLRPAWSSGITTSNYEYHLPSYSAALNTGEYIVKQTQSGTVTFISTASATTGGPTTGITTSEPYYDYYEFDGWYSSSNELRSESSSTAYGVYSTSDILTGKFKTSSVTTGTINPIMLQTKEELFPGGDIKANLNGWRYSGNNALLEPGVAIVGPGTYTAEWSVWPTITYHTDMASDADVTEFYEPHNSNYTYADYSNIFKFNTFNHDTSDYVVLMPAIMSNTVWPTKEDHGSLSIEYGTGISYIQNQWQVNNNTYNIGDIITSDTNIIANALYSTAVISGGYSFGINNTSNFLVHLNGTNDNGNSHYYECENIDRTITTGTIVEKNYQVCTSINLDYDDGTTTASFTNIPLSTTINGFEAYQTQFGNYHFDISNSTITCNYSDNNIGTIINNTMGSNNVSGSIDNWVVEEYESYDSLNGFVNQISNSLMYLTYYNIYLTLVGFPNSSASAFKIYNITNTTT